MRMVRCTSNEFNELRNDAMQYPDVYLNYSVQVLDIALQRTLRAILAGNTRLTR